MQPCPAAGVRPRALATTALLSVAALALSAAPAAQATPRDHDNDGLRNRAELKRFHTKPRKKDTDGDRLGDGAEVKRYKTKPRRKDTDGDRLSDGAEVRRYKTNPRKRDTDGDGLKDRFELKRSKTNPRRKDTDRDGFSDGVEILRGTNPRNPRSKPRAAKPAPPTPPPAPAPTTLPACTTTAANAAAANAAVAAGGPGTVVCLANGSHGAIALNASKAGTVTLRAQNPGGATLGDVTLSGRNLRLAGFVVNGDVTIERASDMAVDHNAITSGSFGVFVNGDKGLVSNVLIAANRISGLGAAAGENDLIRLHVFRGVQIVGNELRNIAETGGHSDVLQSVHGGQGLVFSRNYVHEQQGTQGFFVKDGAVTNLTVADNLIMGDPSPNGYAISFYETSPNPNDPFYTGYGALVRRNTIVDDRSGIAVRGCNHTNVLVDLNVTTAYTSDGCSYPMSGNIVGGSPPFVNPAAGDYRLTNGAAGITWRIADQHFGP